MDEYWVIENKCQPCALNAPHSSTKNKFTEPPSTQWHIRGANYLSDRKKVPSKHAAFKIVGINVFRTNTALYDAGSHIGSLKRYMEAHPKDYFIVVSWILPGPPYHTVVQLLKRTLPEGEDPAFDFSLKSFISGDAKYRNDRFKFLCLVKEAPWALKVAVSSLGGERPVLVGNKLETRSFIGPNYLEMDVNVASSKVAVMLNTVIIRASAALTVDMAFTIEGLTPQELPERVLGTWRWVNCSIDQIAVVVDDDGEIIALDVSRPYIASLQSIEVEDAIRESANNSDLTDSATDRGD